MGLVAVILLAMQEGDVAAWIAELGSEDFKAREATTEKLIGAGVAGLDRLEAALGSGDAEVRSRVDVIVKEVLRRPELLFRTGLLLTRGASWKTVHGKMEFDLKARSLRVTDRREVREAVRELVERMDR